jgi:hypothetical protein
VVFQQLMLDYARLSRLKRIHEQADPLDNWGGLFLEFDCDCDASFENHSILYIQDNGGKITGEFLPTKTRVLAQRISPCILEWFSKRDFEYASIAVPQLSAFVRHRNRVRFHETLYQGEQWARFAQRAVDMRKFLQSNDMLEMYYELTKAGVPHIEQRLTVPLDDDLRVLLKLKFTTSVLTHA